MASSLQKSELRNLKGWIFSTNENNKNYYPSSYTEYEKLISTNTTRYTQSIDQNVINLRYTFNASMQYNGLGNIIIDVVASGRAGKIIKTDSTSGDFNEVILKN